jgi:hypothetical protein
MNILPNTTMPNPLMGFMRQPKIYIRLPSNGGYWPTSSITVPETGEFPVYSMTAKDELAFKTPDALMNGQAVIDVIQSCMPNIKNAWDTPSMDLDLILIAIRIATYGERMEITHRVPNTTEDVSHELDLRELVDKISNAPQWQEEVVIDENITCYVKPLTYRHITSTSLKSFETQRLMQTVNDETLDDEKKLEIFNKSFKIMSNITIDLVAESISAIRIPNGVVSDKKFIREFIENSDSSMVQKIQAHIESIKETLGIQPMLVQSSAEHIEMGAPESYLLPIRMDNSDFFGRGS